MIEAVPRIVLILSLIYDSGAKLQPEEAKKFGQMEQWLSVEAGNFNDNAVPLVWEMRWKPKMKHLGEVDQR